MKTGIGCKKNGNRIKFLLKIFVLPVIIAAIFLGYRANYIMKTENGTGISEATLVRTFNISGASTVSCEIYFWGRLDKKYDNIDELKLLVNDFSDSVGIVKNMLYKFNVTKNDTVEKVEMSGVTEENRDVNISAQLMKEADGKGKNEISEYENGYITVSMMGDMANSALEDARREVSGIFERYGVNPRINSCITGCYKGRLDYSQLNDICIRMFKAAQAKKIEGVRDGNLISISAYTPFIDDFVKTRDKKINLNIAIRYNAYEDKTYIWLGTPVIATEY